MSPLTHLCKWSERKSRWEGVTVAETADLEVVGARAGAVLVVVGGWVQAGLLEPGWHRP